jgi:hypothetical protein
MEDARASVEQSMNDKHGPLALARSRLSVRTSKPGAEVVRDAAERSLEKEIGDLEHSIRKLQVPPPTYVYTHGYDAALCFCRAGMTLLASCSFIFFATA